MAEQKKKVRALKAFFAPGFELVEKGKTVELSAEEANIAIGCGKAEEAKTAPPKAKTAAK